MDIYAAQSLTAFRVAVAIILFIYIVFNRIFHSFYDIWISAATVYLIAFVYVKTLYALITIVVCRFLKNNVFIHHIAVLLKCKRMLVQKITSEYIMWVCLYNM